VDLAEMYATLDQAVESQFTAEQFATVLLGQLRLDTGELRWVNAGHPPPMLLRGHSFVRLLDSVVTLPVGFGGDSPTVATEALEPGDRVVFYTDGVIEERLDGVEFGTQRLIGTLSEHFANRLPVAEVARRVSHDLLRQRGGETSDDATLVILEWIGRTD
jgi:serine phosphatase RsbU (regulator of sigma subunit)